MRACSCRAQRLGRTQSTAPRRRAEHVAQPSDRSFRNRAKKHKPVLYAMSEGTGAEGGDEARRTGRSAADRRSTPRPSLEGPDAGTNGPVSWLEADRLSLPSAEAPVGRAWSRSDPSNRRSTERRIDRTSDSGGAAPDSHRLPTAWPVQVQLSRKLYHSARAFAQVAETSECPCAEARHAMTLRA